MAPLPRWTGRSTARPQDPSLVTGRARFVADLLAPSADGSGTTVEPRLDGAARVVFVRSPHAHAAVTAIDPGPARHLPGVLAVVTAADLDVFPAGRFHRDIPARFVQPLLAERRVRYVGEPVAAVVATSVALAVDAAEAVEIDYEVLTPVLDPGGAVAGAVELFPPGTEARLGPDAPPEPPATGGNLVIDTGWRGSDRSGPSPFDRAEVVVDLRVVNPRQSPAPIEPRVVACAWDDGGLILWAALQRPHGFRDELAALYRLDPSAITVVAGPEVGGGFGGKVGRTAEERIMPLLARVSGRPVAWVETRSEYLAAATQGRGEMFALSLAGTASGRITAVRAEMVKDAGAYPITGAVLPGAWTVPSATGPYAIGHAELRARSVVTNRAPTSAFRGAGRAPYLAALERAVDRYAAAIGRDPAQVRLDNLVTPEAMPHTTPTGAVYDAADYPGDLRRLLDAAGYDELRRRRDAVAAAGGPVRLGVGVACYNHITVGGGGESARVTILPGDRARVVTGTTSQGHGHRATWAQLAADVLALPPERIEVVEGRTDAIASGVGAVGSRSAQTAGVAVHRAAGEVVARARELAAELLEAAVDDIVLAPGSGSGAGVFHVVGTPALAVTWDDLVTAAGGDGHRDDRELDCGTTMDTGGVNTYPSGAHLAVVEVDTETGKVTVVRFVAVDDAGTRINPMIVEGQLHGGIASGIAQVLGEEVVYDDAGNLLTGTFLDYAIGTADQFPSFELVASEVATAVNELGVKGVGESGTIGATPAVHNAVLDALAPLGVTHLDLPCTPERVWRAVATATSP